MDKGILGKWLKAGFMEKNEWSPTEAGTPQGGIISPTLMNMVLDGLETLLREKFSRTRRGHGKYKVCFIRYADDFIIVATSRELLVNEVKPLVENFLKERGLELSTEKSRITHISEGFDFLGQHVRKYKGKPLITPSCKSRKSLRQKVKETLKSLKAESQKTVIGKLNSIIRGWANYHRHVCSKKTFNSLDHWICMKLWKWAIRRHPGKSKRWVKERYFTCVGNRDWVFQASKRVVKGKIKMDKPRLDKDGRVKRLPYPTLVAMSDTPIQRHIKIQCAANPYDPIWKDYFHKRAQRKQMLRKALHQSTGTTLPNNASGSFVVKGFFKA